MNERASASAATSAVSGSPSSCRQRQANATPVKLEEAWMTEASLASGALEEPGEAPRGHLPVTPANPTCPPHRDTGRQTDEETHAIPARFLQLPGDRRLMTALCQHAPRVCVPATCVGRRRCSRVSYRTPRASQSRRCRSLSVIRTSTDCKRPSPPPGPNCKLAPRADDLGPRHPSASRCLSFPLSRGPAGRNSALTDVVQITLSASSGF